MCRKTKKFHKSHHLTSQSWFKYWLAFYMIACTFLVYASRFSKHPPSRWCDPPNTLDNLLQNAMNSEFCYLWWNAHSLILRHPFSLLCFLSAFITARGNSNRLIIVYVCNHSFCVSHKVIVAIPVRNPYWMFFVKSAEDLFRWGTGAIMTRCSQWHHQWSLCGFELRPVPIKQML